MRPDPDLDLDDELRCASLPASALAALADLRREPGVTVTVSGDRAFVRWASESGEVLRRVRPIAGVELYTPTRRALVSARPPPADLRAPRR